MAAVVRADVLESEQVRQLEVELNRGHLPRPSDGIARLDGDLWTVERAAPFVEHKVEPDFRRRTAELCSRDLPLFVAPDRLTWGASRQLEIEVVEAVLAEDLQHERENRIQFAPHRFGRGEDVRVVLG